MRAGSEWGGYAGGVGCVIEKWVDMIEGSKTKVIGKGKTR